MLAKLFNYRNDVPINLSKELISGVINFIAIAYIIIINPMILNAGGAGFPIAPAITSTILVIIIATMIASMIIKLPFVVAPGMSINAMIGYGLILHDKLDVPTVLGVILLSSILFLVVSLSKIRELIIAAIPNCLQIALCVGIGVFLFLIGAKNAGVVTSNQATIIGIGHLGLQVLLTFAGFILAAVLLIKGKKYAFLLPIALITIVYLMLNPQAIPHSFVQMPDFSLFMHMNILAALKLSLLPAILSLFVVNFFDATSTVMGLVGQLGKTLQQDKPYYLRRALMTDSIGGILSGIMGTSPVVIFIESSAAIKNGAVTGIPSMITALLCIPCLFLSPLIAAIPSAATSPILMLVGILMVAHIREIHIANLEELIAVALTIVMMPLCFSITAGAIFGVISYTLLKLLLGKGREVSPMLIVIAVVCCGWFWLL